jgi:hypothetical protein
MKRLYQSTEPAEGSVYRNLTCELPESSSSGAPDEVGCLECLGNPIVGVISPPGCSSFPTTDNDYGSIPTTFASDVEIDPDPFDPLFGSLSSEIPDPTFTDLWGKLGPGHQSTVLVPDCYCPGEGIEKPALTIGRPAFPVVRPLPFFWIPAGSPVSSAITVREQNPASSLPADCCDTGEERIEAVITQDGELQLTPFLKPDLPREYRASDIHTTFQLKAGYPRYCCIEDDCGESSGDPNFTLRYLHFPRWPGPDTHDPYNSSNAKEPLGLIPVLTDLQCDENTGLAYLYRANLAVHDGHIALVQWDADPPRSSSFDPTEPPTDPTLLDVNRDYQGREIFDSDQFNNPIGEKCQDTCLEAAANLGVEGCTPTCPSDGALCSDNHFGVVSTGTGITEMAAILAAFANSTTDVGNIGCTPESTTLCYTTETETGWEAAVKACCPNP